MAKRGVLRAAGDASLGDRGGSFPAAAPGGSSVTADGPRREPSAAAGARVPSTAEVDDCHERYFAQVIAIVFACVIV